MCRTAHSVLSTLICGIQMLVRVFMTIILMIENLIRMILQTLYNFISFMLQMFSLIPICVVFLLTARLKCFMCGGGGPCPINRGGACDCLMSAAAIVLLFFIFRATGVLDKIFYKIGYVQAPPVALVKYAPTPGEITECSRPNEATTASPRPTPPPTAPPPPPIDPGDENFMRDLDYSTETEIDTEGTLTEFESTWEVTTFLPATVQKIKINVDVAKSRVQRKDDSTTQNRMGSVTENPQEITLPQIINISISSVDATETNEANNFASNLTTVLYYLV